ncbi:MAG TPA: DoxX family protein [Phycisphaerae bacterium]|nr:DoxX family protein [Phycisphaerae bacterium]
METSTEKAKGSCFAGAILARGLGLLIVRLAVGSIFIYHGAQKVFGAFGGMGMQKFAASAVAALHPPILPTMAWAWLSAGTEFFGGCLVLVGLITRLPALLLVINMLMALRLLHMTGTGFADPNIEFVLSLIAMNALLVLAGPGILSLDALLFRCGKWCFRASNKTS